MTTKIGYQAIGDCLVIDPNIKDKTDSGIYVPEQAQEDNIDIFTEVVSIGDKITNIKVGDKVAINNTARPTLITIGEKKYFSIKDYDVIGKLVEQIPA